MSASQKASSSGRDSDTSYVEENFVLSDEDAAEKKEGVINVLGNMVAAKGFDKYGPDKIRISCMIGLLGLSVLINEENDLTLADLAFFVETGAISYQAALKNIPGIMTLNGSADFGMFRPVYSMHLLELRSHVLQLSRFLHLKTVDFNREGILVKTIARYLNEFSLPSKLLKVIRRSFEFTTDFFDLKQEFLPDILWNADNAPNTGVLGSRLVTVEVRALSLILLALKYIYGMDDITEEYLSEAAKEFNQKIASKNGDGQNSAFNKKLHFVIADWLKLSRRRLFLISQFSHQLCVRFVPRMFDNVELSPATLRAKYENETLSIKEKLSHGRGRACEAKFMKMEGMYKDIKEIMDKNVGKKNFDTSKVTKTIGAKMIGDESTGDKTDLMPRVLDFGSDVESENGSDVERDTRPPEVAHEVLKKNDLDLLSSRSPLQDFSSHFISLDGTLDQKVETLPRRDVKKLSELLAMAERKMGRIHQPKDSGSNTVKSDLEHWDTQIKGLRRVNFLTDLDPPKFLGRKNPALSNIQGKSVRFDGHVYWKTSGASFLKDQGHRSNDFLVSLNLPENFNFVLEYFTAYVGVTSNEVLSDIANLEFKILKVQPDFFGKELKDAKLSE